MIALSECALVLVGHGSTLNADSSDPTHAHARTLREGGIFREVYSCFWKEEPSMREVLRMVDSEFVFIVPVFISEGYFTQKVIPREFGITGPFTRVAGKMLAYCDPVGSHPRMTEVLLRRAQEVAPGVATSEISLLIVGHGTALNENSARAAKDQVARIRSLGEYGEVAAAYMEEPPRVSEWPSLTHRKQVVVVPFFIADGLHSYEDIPVMLGIDAGSRGAAIFRRNPHELHGRQLYYASSIGTEPLLAAVVLDQVNAFLDFHGIKKVSRNAGAKAD